MKFKIRPAALSDTDEINRIYDVEMGTSIGLQLTKYPDYRLASSVQSESFIVIIGESVASGEIAGIFAIGNRQVYLNGEEKAIPYWADLRILPNYKRSTLLFLFSKYFIKNFGVKGISQTMVFEDNDVMRQLINRHSRRRKNQTLPLYYRHRRYITQLIHSQNLPQRASHFVRCATIEDIPAIQSFFDQWARQKQFFPHYDFSKIGTSPYYRNIKISDFWLAYHNSEIIGLLGLWDQSQFKQTRITQYALWLKMLRPIYNFFANFVNGISLPAPEAMLNYVAAHAIVIKDNDPAVFASLLSGIRSSHLFPQKILAVGLDEKDPLRRTLARIPFSRCIQGAHYIVSYEELDIQAMCDPVYYVELGRI